MVKTVKTVKTLNRISCIQPYSPPEALTHRPLSLSKEGLHSHASSTSTINFGNKAFLQKFERNSAEIRRL